MFHKWFKCNKHIAWNLDIAKVKDFWDLENASHFPDALKLLVNKWNFVTMKILGIFRVSKICNFRNVQNHAIINIM